MSRFSTAFTFIVLLWSGGVLFGQESPPPQDTQPFLKKCSKTNPPPCADTPPSLISAPDPECSQDARKAKINDTVVLALVVGTDGLAHDISVLKSVGHGLDDEAIKAMKKWKFKPGKSLGKSVPVQIRIESTFRCPEW